MFERAGSALEILRRLSEALGSNDPARRHGGLALVNELVDVNEWSRVGTGAARFCRLLRAAPDEIALAVRTLGHALRSAGAAATDATDAELSRALEWLHAETPAAASRSHRRLSSCLIVTELAMRSGPQAASADPLSETRIAAIGMLRSCLAIVSQREGGLGAWYEAALSRSLAGIQSYHPEAAAADSPSSSASSSAPRPIEEGGGSSGLDEAHGCLCALIITKAEGLGQLH
ncbi:hypothetical protein EMIHUDRAFT_234652 [Emiliania huxleyi CCMP1516]|uniref:Uncharacterized protein n=2 Tax=Emiliania huxleyi TaxID=2903 RepID=A0A0D3JZ68_EMIH1|nr:hypothetical protein EMIHUDRAFT_234652 [Emiliania huxleyi CCMP1516]EOD28803.1 hypothetical protein EMIHUDRAFT_234652 [Emiliania huxleyi CCMP1516]|eukprot:XP_005781232.1 hypothetical protein EMIHUDRAFT_234652 [Emiliania huxleyi CCMP1516]